MGRFKGIAAGGGKGETRTPKPKADTPAPKSDPAAAPAQKVEQRSAPSRGRPKGSGKQGKRSMKDRKLAGAYVKKTTHKAVMRELIDDPRDFSDLVEELLEGWLEGRK